MFKEIHSLCKANTDYFSLYKEDNTKRILCMFSKNMSVVIDCVLNL